MLLTLLQSQGAPPSPSGVTVWLKVGSVWKQATMYIKVAGTWKTATTFTKISGTWK
jgi:hypothetical protein